MNSFAYFELLVVVASGLFGIYMHRTRGEGYVRSRMLKGRHVSRPLIRTSGYMPVVMMRVTLVLAAIVLLLSILLIDWHFTLHVWFALHVWETDDLLTGGDDQPRRRWLEQARAKFVGALRPVTYRTST